jgi:hypothetical protein
MVTLPGWSRTGQPSRVPAIDELAQAVARLDLHTPTHTTGRSDPPECPQCPRHEKRRYAFPTVGWFVGAKKVLWVSGSCVVQGWWFVAMWGGGLTRVQGLSVRGCLAVSSGSRGAGCEAGQAKRLPTEIREVEAISALPAPACEVFGADARSRVRSDRVGGCAAGLRRELPEGPLRGLYPLRVCLFHSGGVRVGGTSVRRRERP